MSTKRFLAALILLATFLLSAQSFGQVDEKIRSSYGVSMAEVSLEKLKANGFNACMWGANRPSPVTGGKIEWKNNRLEVQYNEEIVNGIARAAELAHRYGMKLFVTLKFNENTMAALQKLGKYGMGAVEGPRSYNAKGIQPAPWPGEKKYWNGILQAEAVCIAKIARDHPGIAGILIDVEMYGGGGLQMWRYNTSFDDNSFDAFRQKYSSSRTIPPVPIGKRYIWLKKNGLLEDYHNCLRNIIFDNARLLAQAVHNENPKIMLGMFPFSVNWFYDGFIKGLAEGTKKDVWIFPEKEYELGYTADVDATISHLKKMGLSFRYVSGLWIGKHEPFALAWNAGRAAEKADGYWLFSASSLFGDPNRLDGPYSLAEGATQEQYWQALKAVNQLIEAGNLYPPSQKLITPNPWADGTPEQSKVSYKYSIQPDAPTAEDAHRTALFDGLITGHVVGTTAAWSLSTEQINRSFSVIVDFAKECTLGRIAMAVALDSLSNLRTVDKVTVNIRYRAAGQWKNLARIGPDKFRKEASYFNVDISLDKPVKTNMVLITLQPRITKEQMHTLIKRWDGLFLGLSEVAIWSQ